MMGIVYGASLLVLHWIVFDSWAMSFFWMISWTTACFLGVVLYDIRCCLGVFFTILGVVWGCLYDIRCCLGVCKIGGRAAKTDSGPPRGAAWEPGLRSRLARASTEKRRNSR